MRRASLLAASPLLMAAAGDWTLPAVIAGVMAIGGAGATLWQLIAIGRAVGRIEQRLDHVEASVGDLKGVPVEIARLRGSVEAVKDKALMALSRADP